ncbi:hypothetical protein J2Z48_002790 [Croceifilum oryzae]|uniref:PqqD family protein n=1 Tax=Croceifilum oryzae TaxID=1553429 RepID=A0AAJ1WRJ6_9BACL|nr:PqqD family protein [Croceifilum oryzae]MDQ0418587.1 hypothetical protein [Croceifilum oryzae]
MYNKIPSLPVGIRIEEEALYDEHLHVSVPINQTAKMMLLEVDGVKNMEEIVHNLSQTFEEVEEDRLFDDTVNLFHDLSQNYILNWKGGSVSKWKSILFQFLFRYNPRYRERFNLSDKGFFAIFLKILWIVVQKIAIFWVLFMAASLVLYIYAPFDFILYASYYYTVTYAGLIVSFALHETMHAYMHRRMTQEQIGFLAADWMSIRFVRPIIKPYPKKMLWVTLLGPLVPGMIGIVGLLLMCTVVNVGNMATYTLHTIFGLFALHIFYLLPFTGDGKSLVKQLSYYRLES